VEFGFPNLKRSGSDECLLTSSIIHIGDAQNVKNYNLLVHSKTPRLCILKKGNLCTLYIERLDKSQALCTLNAKEFLYTKNVRTIFLIQYGIYCTTYKHEDIWHLMFSQRLCYQVGYGLLGSDNVWSNRQLLVFLQDAGKRFEDHTVSQSSWPQSIWKLWSVLYMLNVETKPSIVHMVYIFFPRTFCSYAHKFKSL
jgi:hypothetical protein